MRRWTRCGGLDALGGPKTDNMYHAGWAWAGNTPFQYTKLIASHFGGTRNPMVISWPKGIKPDKTPRAQFHHVNDIAPTIYEIVGIKPPKVVDGFVQDPIDGVSMAYTFRRREGTDAQARAVLRQQRQPRNLPGRLDRGDVRPAGAVAAGGARPREWDSAKDRWELYDLTKDFSEADDLAAKDPKRLEADAEHRSLSRRRPTRSIPMGAGIWLRLHPEDRIKTPYTSWQFRRRPPRACPSSQRRASARESNLVTIDAEIGDNASGVLYALGGAGAGSRCTWTRVSSSTNTT